MSDSPARVVITGMGVISPIGCDVDPFWESLQNGTSGIRKLLSTPDDASLPVQYGGEVQEFQGNIEDFGPLDKNLQRNIRKWQKVMCREIELGVAACQKALHHSGFDETKRNPDRIGITYGCDYILSRPEEFADGIAACLDADRRYQMEKWPTVGMDKLNPLWLLKYLPNMPASHVAIYNDLRGPSNSLTVREASNNLSIGEAMSVIQRGVADAMIVGSTGSAVQPVRALYIAGQAQMAPHAPEDPSSMSRPFDLDRQGMVLGEGAGAMVLESLESAQGRGATIWGEVVATSASAVGSRPDRDHIRMVVKNLLTDLAKRCERDLSQPFHIQACGRGEIATDISESLGIQDVFGARTARIPVVASKSYFGNLGAGGAAVEVVAGCLALYHDRLFETLNYRTPDPRCPIVVGRAGDSAGNAFVHLSFTREGQASAVLIRRFAS